ncbi:hypothetical protein PCK1_001461 [Pneumocystis canis]|nr:hypothetical protein PCK1_001461 [Pneumocystis canis]
MSFKRRVTSGSLNTQKSSETSILFTEQTLDSGVCPSPLNGVHITSSGCSSFDSITGLGGLPLGTCFLIEETGTTDFSSILLRYFSAEGILHEHGIWSCGVPRAWFYNLPDVESNAYCEKSKQSTEVMKIAWRYRNSGDFKDTLGMNRGPGIDKFENVPYCHTFNLTKSLKIPYTASITCSKFVPMSLKPYSEFISDILKLLSSKSPQTIRLIIPDILSPAFYPSESLKHKNVLEFFHTLRALLRTYSNRLVAMISISTQLYSRETGIVRYLELLSDGVLELIPFLNTKSTDGFEGLVKLHKLPFSQNLLNQNKDLAFKISRKRFSIESWTLPPADEKELLTSKYEREKLIGLKKSMLHGIDMSEYFLPIVKNITFSNLEIQKFLYTYITHYAEYEPNLALLSINIIQKALNSQNPFSRGMSIRVLSGIRVPSILKIILLEIKHCIMDMSSYVRKAASISIVKCYRLDPSSLPTLIEYLSFLLNDKSHIVLGSALFVFQEICPERLDLIHPHYRRICRVLHKLNEWDQVIALNILLIYARKCFLMPEDTLYCEHHNLNEEMFYSSEKSDQKTSKSVDNTFINKDLDLLLTSIVPLFRSKNSSVTYYWRPLSRRHELAKPLIWLLKENPDIQYIVLTNIAAIAIKHPIIFSPFYKHFFLYPSDSENIWKLKLEILSLISTKENVLWYTKSLNPNIISNAIKSIGYCATNHYFISEICLQSLMGNINNINNILVEESVLVISQLIQLNPKDHLHYIEQLVLHYDSISIASVRTYIIHLVSENIFSLPKLSIDVLRILAKSFSQQEEIVKNQIIVFATKLYIIYNFNCDKEQLEDSPLDSFLRKLDISNISDKNTILSRLIEDEDEIIYNNSLNKEIVIKLYNYIMLLARYDLSYDLRDRARLYKSLTLNPTSREAYTIGSSSLTLLESVKGYEDLPSWLNDITQLPDANLREVFNETLEDINNDFSKTSILDKKDELTLSNLRSIEMQELDNFYKSNTDTESTNLESETGFETDFSSEKSMNNRNIEAKL